MHGVVVPHASGARVVVQEVTVANAWRGVLEGVPGQRFFERILEDAAKRFRDHDVRARLIAHPPTAPGAPPLPAHSVEQWGPRAPHAPRWLVGASATVEDARGEGGARAVAFWWFTNEAFTTSLEEMLLAGLHDIPLEGDIPPSAPDTRGPWMAFVAHDGAGVTVNALALRFAFEGAPSAALQGWARGGARVVSIGTGAGTGADLDAPVLLHAELRGPAIEGPRNPDALEYFESTLSLACVVPAPGGETLEAVVRRALAAVSWHAIATPTLGP